MRENPVNRQPGRQEEGADLNGAEVNAGKATVEGERLLVRAGKATIRGIRATLAFFEDLTAGRSLPDGPQITGERILGKDGEALTKIREAIAQIPDSFVRSEHGRDSIGPDGEKLLVETTSGYEYLDHDQDVSITVVLGKSHGASTDPARLLPNELSFERDRPDLRRVPTIRNNGIFDGQTGRSPRHMDLIHVEQIGTRTTDLSTASFDADLEAPQGDAGPSSHQEPILRRIRIRFQRNDGYYDMRSLREQAPK